jgi:hypothetical protein
LFANWDLTAPDPESKAQALAKRFLECFDEEDARYYTNGGYYPNASSPAWYPATTATFDT